MTLAWVRGIAVSTRCAGRVAPGSEFSRYRPAVPDDLCPVQRACGFNQKSWATRARVRVLAGSISCPGDSGPCPKSRSIDLLSRAYRAVVQGPQVRSDVPGHLDPFRRCRGVDQLSRMTRTHVRVLKVSTSCPRLLTIWSEGPWCRPALLDDSRLGQTSRDVDQLSHTIRDRFSGPAGLTQCPETRARDRVPTGSTSCLGRIGPVPVCPWYRTDALGDSGP